ARPARDVDRAVPVAGRGAGAGQGAEDAGRADPVRPAVIDWRSFVPSLAVRSETMATVPSADRVPVYWNGYPTSDGKPMAETDWHRDLMAVLIQTLRAYYCSDSQVYVSGNLLLFYVPGDKRRHVSPDVFVVKGVPKRDRPNYLVWQEGKGPDVVIELTSS